MSDNSDLINYLPAEMVESIAKYLSPAELAKLMQTSAKFKAFAKDVQDNNKKLKAAEPQIRNITKILGPLIKVLEIHITKLTHSKTSNPDASDKENDWVNRAELTVTRYKKTLAELVDTLKGKRDKDLIAENTYEEYLKPLKIAIKQVKAAEELVAEFRKLG